MCGNDGKRERETERERASEQRFGRRTEAVLSLQVLAALAFWIAMSVRISGVFLQRERESEQTFYASNFKSKFNYLKNSTIQNAPIR